MEENNEELSRLAQEVGKSFQNLANNVKNKSLKRVRENLRELIKNMIKLAAKAIWAALKVILGFVLAHFGIIFLVICLIIVVYYPILSFFGKAVNGDDDKTAGTVTITSESNEMIEFDENQKNYKIKEDYAKSITDQLDKNQVDTEIIGFLNNENVEQEDGTSVKELQNMIEKYIKAQLYTMFPKIGSKKIDGCILINRMSLNENNEYESEQLEYKPWNEFNELLNSGDSEEDLTKYFSLDPETFELCLVYSIVRVEYDKGTDQDGNEDGYVETGRTTTYQIQKFDYQSGISKYATPVSFFIAMHLISQNVDFMNDLVKLVMDNTEITISFVENPIVEYEYADYSGKALIASYSMPLSTGEGISQGILAGATAISLLLTGKSLGFSIDGIGSDVLDGMLSGLKSDAESIIGDLMDEDDSSGLRENIRNNINSDSILNDSAEDSSVFNSNKAGQSTDKVKESDGTTVNQTAFDLNNTTLKAEHLLNYNNSNVQIKKVMDVDGISGADGGTTGTTTIIDGSQVSGQGVNAVDIDRDKIKSENYDKSANFELKPALAVTTNNVGYLYVTHAKTWLLQSDLEIVQGTENISGPETYSQLHSGTKVEARYNGLTAQLTLKAHLIIVKEKITTKVVTHEISATETSSGYDVTDFITLLDEYPRVENNLMTAPSLLFELLEKDEKTQELEKVLKYVLMLMTGNSYGVDKLEAFDTTGAVAVGAKTADGMDVSDLAGTDEVEEANELQKKIALIAANSSKYGVTANGGLCLRWMIDVYDVATNSKAPRKRYARQAGYYYGVSKDKSHIPLGAALYGYGRHKPVGQTEWGHCGIYIGNGMVASCIGNNNVKIEPVDGENGFWKKYNVQCWGWYTTTPVNSKYPITEGLMDGSLSRIV